MSPISPSLSLSLPSHSSQLPSHSPSLPHFSRLRSLSNSLDTPERSTHESISSLFHRLVRVCRRHMVFSRGLCLFGGVSPTEIAQIKHIAVGCLEMVASYQILFF